MTGQVFAYVTAIDPTGKRRRTLYLITDHTMIEAEGKAIMFDGALVGNLTFAGEKLRKEQRGSKARGKIA